MVRKIVIVEDNPADAKTMQFAIGEYDRTIQTEVLRDGAQAVQFFAATAPTGASIPCDLILLDLNLPLVSGFEVLQYLKANAPLRTVPVLILSGSGRAQDVDRCYELGANSYLVKPTGIEEVLRMTAQVLSYWFVFAKLSAGPVQGKSAKHR